MVDTQLIQLQILPTFVNFRILLVKVVLVLVQLQNNLCCLVN